MQRYSDKGYRGAVKKNYTHCPRNPRIIEKHSSYKNEFYYTVLQYTVYKVSLALLDYERKKISNQMFFVSTISKKYSSEMD
jgi:hypothetical protein